MLVLKRIHVVYTIHAPDSARETIERVHGIHHKSCPIYRSIGSAIDITTEYHIEAPNGIDEG